MSVEIYSEKSKNYVLKKKYCGHCRNLQLIPELKDHVCCQGVELTKVYLKFVKTQAGLHVQMKKMTWIQVQLQGVVCQGIELIHMYFIVEKNNLFFTAINWYP